MVPKSKISGWLDSLMLMALVAAPMPTQAKGLAGWTDSQIAKRSADYSKLDPVEIARTISVKSDELEPVAVLTSEPAYKFKGGFTNEVRADTFLRVLINRRSGATVWQIYQRLTYTFDRREFDGVNYAGGDGPVTARLTIAGSDLKFVGSYPLREDTLAFEIPEALALEIAARAATSPGTPWRFRFKSRAGMDWTDDLPPAEFAGMRLAVEHWRRQNRGKSAR